MARDLSEPDPKRSAAARRGAHTRHMRERRRRDAINYLMNSDPQRRWPSEDSIERIISAMDVSDA